MPFKIARKTLNYLNIMAINDQCKSVSLLRFSGIRQRLLFYTLFFSFCFIIFSGYVSKMWWRYNDQRNKKTNGSHNTVRSLTNQWLELSYHQLFNYLNWESHTEIGINITNRELIIHRFAQEIEKKHNSTPLI